MHDTTLRVARPDEAGALTELIRRSKAHWGYHPIQLDAWRDELCIRPGEVTARRTVVAERDGRAVGVSTVEGEPPDGVLGLLFVEPSAIGGGVGRALFRHVLREAGRLGFTRLTLEADPHAVGFYRAVGARQIGTERSAGGRDLPVFAAWPIGPEPAWRSRDPAVPVGNVAEFNGQFTGGTRGPDHYSCLVAFCVPRPMALVLPEPVGDWWVRDTGAVLGWDEVEVHSGIARDGRVSRALPDHLRDAPLLPWGRTAEVDRGSAAALAAVRRYESKRHANALFHTLAPDHPGVTVPRQRPVRSRRALALEPLAVLKTEYGVGGSGTMVVGPGKDLPWRLPRNALVEEYVPGEGPHRNPTFDAVVDARGEVQPVGVGLMNVEGTGYLGVTVGDGVVPDRLAATATAFGTAVGRELAAAGYRGWYDVDFVTAGSSLLAPVEINLRFTGPAAAFHLRAALDASRGGRHLVRTIDRLPLGARLPDPALHEHVARVRQRCADLGALLVITIPTAGFDPVPWLGVALAARTRAELDAAETAVREANADLALMFHDLDVSRRDAPRRGRARPRRSSRGC
ncbi:GNAT family N-acetyltransferase [Amycolatopsis sp. NPDC051128]|uniref:GNAT family N-acetyltransferase n=1 Tax=Amycolatopsis sp. NPDC051128 TaxID=3155412 RepID=UPI00341D7923